MKDSLKVKNRFGEKLDVLVEGIDNNKTIIFVHGFGVDKNEGSNLFVDIQKALNDNFRTVRFDFSGCGASEGDSKEMNHYKLKDDLLTILDFARLNFPGELNIIAHSMGTIITAMASPSDIKKTVFSGVPHPTAAETFESIKKRIISRGGDFQEEGITVFPRSNGGTTYLGPSFWTVLKELNKEQLYRDFSKKTDLILFKPKQDHIVLSRDFSSFKNIKTLKYVELPGDHVFSNDSDRKVLIQRIKEHFGC